MAGYRVAGPRDDDPLAVDEEQCQRQRFSERLQVHVLFSVLTVGLWLPGLVGWLALSSRRMARFAEGYRVRIRDGVLTAGNAHSSRSIPLDSIADASISGGKATVTVVGGTPLLLYGLRDPEAAVDAILQARRAHLEGGRGAARVRVAAPVETEEQPVEDARRSDERSRAR